MQAIEEAREEERAARQRRRDSARRESAPWQTREREFGIGAQEIGGGRVGREGREGRVGREAGGRGACWNWAWRVSRRWEEWRSEARRERSEREREDMVGGGSEGGPRRER